MTAGNIGSPGSPRTTGDLHQMRSAHTTLSSVAVGTDADQQLLEALARAGRGRSYVTTEPSEIPQVFTRETLPGAAVFVGAVDDYAVQVPDNCLYCI